MDKIPEKTKRVTVNTTQIYKSLPNVEGAIFLTIFFFISVLFILEKVING